MIRVTVRKKFLLGVFFIPSLLQAQSSFRCVVGNKGYVSLKKMGAMIDKKRIELHKMYTSLNIIFQFWHEDKYDTVLWNTFARKFLDFSLFCKSKNWTNMEPLLLCEPFSSMVNNCGKESGIACLIDTLGDYRNKIALCFCCVCQDSCMCKHKCDCCCIAQCNADADAPCTCKTFLSKKNKKVMYYDEVVWQKMVDAYAAFMHKIITKSEFTAVFSEGFPFLKEILRADKDFGIHGIVVMGLGSPDGNDIDLVLMYELQKTDSKELEQRIA